MVDRNDNVPGKHASSDDHDADVQAENVTDAEERGGQGSTHIEESAANVAGQGSGIGNVVQATGGSQLHDGAAQRRAAEYLDSLRWIFTGTQHFRGGLSLREGELLIAD